MGDVELDTQSIKLDKRGSIENVGALHLSDYAKRFARELEKELHMTQSSKKRDPSERRTFLYAWGMNTNGQLGFSPYNEYPETKGVDVTNLHDAAAMTENILGHHEKTIREADIPRLTWIPDHIAYNLDIVSIATSYYHTLFVDNKGHVYAFGGGENGTLGLGYEKIEQHVPRRILHLSKPIKMVAAGRYHSLALDVHGVVYSWGSSKDGKLGLGDLKENDIPGFLNYPKAVAMDGDANVTYITAGETNSFAIASSKRYGKNCVYVTTSVEVDIQTLIKIHTSNTDTCGEQTNTDNSEIQTSSRSEKIS